MQRSSHTLVFFDLPRYFQQEGSRLRRAMASVHSTQEGLSSRSGAVGLSLLVLGVCISQAMWIRFDSRPMAHTDPYSYLTGILQFIHELQLGSSLAAALDFLSLGGRPVLYQLITIPVGLLFGFSEDVVLAQNLLFLALLMVATYALGHSIANRTAGLLAAFLVATYPPIVHLVHIYRPHTALPACLALYLWLLLRLERRRSEAAVWACASALAAGVLIHPALAALVALPTAVTLMRVVLSRPGDGPTTAVSAELVVRSSRSLVWRAILPAFGLAVGAPALWQLTLGRNLLASYARWVSPELAALRGFEKVSVGFTATEPSGWWYLLTAPGAISWFFAVLAALAIFRGLADRQFYTRLVLIQLVSGYFFLSFFDTVLAWWRFATLLPVLACLIAKAIVELEQRKLRWSLGGACLLVAVLNFNFVLWGVSGPLHQRLMIALGAAIDGGTCSSRAACAYCPSPPRQEHWPVRELLATVLADPACQESEPCGLLIAAGTQMMPKQMVRYWRAREWPDRELRIGPHRSLVWGGRYPANELLTSDYLVYVKGEGSTRPTSRRRITELLLRSPPPAFAAAHREIGGFEIPNGESLALLKRVEPLTAIEVESTLEALGMSEGEIEDTGVLLGRLYLLDGEPQKAAEVLTKALRREPESGWAQSLLKQARAATLKTPSSRPDP